MLIHEMTNQECLDTLARLRLGRLGCARDNQPYVVPIYFASHKGGLYAFSTLGKKIEWMRANPRVCVEADEFIAHNQWMSVVAFGHYEEFPDTPEYKPERNRAYALLQQRAMWWQPAYVASAHHGAAEPLVPIFFCIHIDRVTGHRATPDSVQAAALAGATMASGKSDELKGRLKEAAGALTCDRKLKREGKADQAVGKIKQKVEKVIDKVKDALS